MAKPTKGSKADRQAANDLVTKALKDVESAWTAMREFRLAMLDDTNLVIGGERAWLAEDVAKLKGEQRPILHFNIMAGLVNFLCGYQIERWQDFRAFPRGDEDEALGRYLTTCMKYAVDIGQGRDQFSRHFRKGVIGGISVLEVGHGYDYCDDLLEGEITFPLLDPLCWGYDPFARRYDRQDAQYQFKLMWMNEEEVKRRWGQTISPIDSDWIAQFQSVNTRDTEPDPTGSIQWVNQEKHQYRICQYWRRVPKDATILINRLAPPTEDRVLPVDSPADAEKFLQRVADTAGLAAANGYTVQTVNTETYLIGPQGAQRMASPDEAEARLAAIRSQAGLAARAPYEIITRPTTALRVAHLTGKELLDDQPPPLGADWRYPFVPFVPYQENDSPSSIKGIVRDGKDPQREIDWHYSSLLDKIVRGPKNPMFVPKAENYDMAKFKSEIGRPGYVGEYTSAPPVVVNTPSPIQEELTLIESGIRVLLQIVGVNAEMIGQTTQKTVSGRAIASRQAGGLVGVNALMQNWQATLRGIGELLVRRIQHDYSPEKMRRIIGRSQAVDAMQMGMPGMPLLPPGLNEDQLMAQLKSIVTVDMDVVIDFQEASPTARTAIVAQLMQFLAAGMPIPPDILITASDVPFKEEILAALKAKGMGQPNEALAKVLGAGQGQSAPTGVNKS